MTPSNAETPRARATEGLSGRHVLAAMLAFFGAIVVVNAIMIYHAITTFGGLDNVNAYRDGLAYNSRIAREARQAALGWTDTVEVEKSPARVRISIRDAQGNAPSGLRVAATLGRPATNAADTPLRLAETAAGTFEAALESELAPGAWIATVSAARTDAPDAEPLYEARRRLWITP